MGLSNVQSLWWRNASMRYSIKGHIINRYLQMRYISYTSILYPAEFPKGLANTPFLCACYLQKVWVCVIPHPVSVLLRALGHTEAVTRWYPSDPEGFPPPGGPLHCRCPQNGLSRDHHARCKWNPLITPNPCTLFLFLSAGLCALRLLSTHLLLHTEGFNSDKYFYRGQLNR